MIAPVRKRRWWQHHHKAPEDWREQLNQGIDIHCLTCNEPLVKALPRIEPRDRDAL